MKTLFSIFDSGVANSTFNGVTDRESEVGACIRAVDEAVGRRRGFGT